MTLAKTLLQMPKTENLQNQKMKTLMLVITNDTGEDFITDAEDGELTEPEDENTNVAGDNE